MADFSDTNDDAAPGVPEWVVTYGDMMSLLLTFFIMLVSLSEVVAEEKYRQIMEALQNYMGYRTAPKAPEGTNFPLNSMIEKLTTLGSYTNEDTGTGGVKTQGLEGQDVLVTRNREGLASFYGRPLNFERGSVELAADAKRELWSFAAELSGKPNKIEVVGHVAPPRKFDQEATDREKFTISYRRARRVADELIEFGIAPGRLRINAAGDSQPLPEIGDEQGAWHERVEIYMLDAFTDEFVGPAGVPD